MTFALDLPDSINQWPTWLEQQLVGLNLRQLVRQWEVLADIQPGSDLTSKSSEVQLRELLGKDLVSVLERGLSGLSEDRLRALIQRPRLLLSLQEIVFCEGGAYWQSVPRATEHQQAADRVRQQLFARLATEANDTPATSDQSPHVLPAFGRQVVQSPASSLSTRRIWMGLAALAASLIFAMLFWQSQAAGGRYFARAGLLTSTQKGKQFGDLLAKAIREDWKQASQPNLLARELTTFRDSCDLVITGNFDQLDAQVVANFKQRCEKWRQAFSDYLDELKSGQPEKAVYQKANATVEKLLTFLEGLS